MRILFAGGGTGGHLIPAINIAGTLAKKMPDAELRFVGIKGGMEKDIVEKNGYELDEIEVVGLKRNFSGLLDFSRKIMKAYSQADNIVKSFGPEIVVGTGGYVSAPVVLAGKRRKARILIQEQNIYPGLATRFLSRFADKTCLAFEGSKKYFQGMKNISVTGNPLRDDLVLARGNGYLNEFGLDQSKKVLFVTGGSRGAKSLNAGILNFISEHKLPDDWQILWQTGTDKYDELIASLKTIEYSGKVMPFIHDMPKAYATADLIVCRAGAMTLSEILALGLPSLLVPFPFATADHQMKNALDLKAKGAVEVIADKKVDSAEFSELLSSLLNNKNRREQYGKTAGQLGSLSGSESITEEIVKLI